MANALTGENFGAGFASGAFASFAGSGAQWAGLGKGGVLGATTLFGGIGSATFGGDFLDGAMTGLNIGLYNHTWEENGITYNDDEPGNITGQIDEVFVDGYHQTHLTLSLPTAPVEKGLELVFPEFEILTGIRAIFNGAFKAAGSSFERVFGGQQKLQYDLRLESQLDTYHNFPYSFDKTIIRYGEKLPTTSNGMMYRLKGSINGVDGYYGIKISKDGKIFHRQFMELRNSRKMY